MGMTIDITDFEQGFKALMFISTPETLARGMFAAGNALLRDSIEEPPQAPFKIGDLRASARVDEAEVTGDGLMTVVGFNIAYAARWHELSPADSEWINWTRTGAKQPGSQYLITKMARNSARYLAIVGEHLRALLGG